LRQLVAGDRNVERRALDVSPGVRLVAVTRVEHLVGRGGGQAGVDALESRERLDRTQRYVLSGDLLLKLLGELEDPQVLANPRLAGLQPLRDALDGQARVEETLIAPAAGDGIQVSA
jgi:hypothetical protein